MNDWLVLSGILIVVIGFLLRLNPLLVVTVAAFATGLAAGLDLVAVVSAFGRAFNENRYVSIVWILLPVIGLLERYGLQQRARALIAKFRTATTGRLLLVYLLFRQITAALGLTSVAGHPQTVRPIVAPMAEAAAEQQHGTLDDPTREKVKAYSAATDNVGLFFGEDIFIAIGSILLMKGFLEQYGIILDPLDLSVWAIPTAIAAFLIHGARLLLLDRRLKRKGGAAMITLPWLYALAGAMFAAFALLSALDGTNSRRFGNAAFWGLLAVSFFAGDRLGDFGNGILVLGLVALAGFHALGRGDPPTTTDGERIDWSKKLGNKLFLPALVIPATALLGTFLLKDSGLVDPAQVTLISLGLGVLIALAVCFAWLKPPLLAPLQEGRRLMDSVGWAAVLPQMLAALGAVFALAGVGEVVGGIAGDAIPDGSLFAAVAAYAIGMALFTMIMGNAFAAFPVMTAAIGIPILIGDYGGEPAIVCAIGMLAGFCGTLMTPMAANFNIVPAVLLDLKDQNGVVKAQVGTAIPLLFVNLLLIYFLAF